MARRRISDLTDGPEPEMGSVFGPGDDNTVPGEVLFALQPDAIAESATSLLNLPLRGVTGAGEATSGAPGVDKALAKLGVESISRVHGPSPGPVVRGVAMASDLGLDTTVRVRYTSGEAPDAVAKRLNRLGEVAWAEPNRWREASIVPNDPQFGTQWGLTRIGCPAAWDLTTGDPSIVVAVVDTGVDLNHPELAPLLVGGQDFVDFPPGSIPRPGWVFEGDFTGVDATAQDEVGHGTHVAGTICCLSNNATGVAGVAWNVRLMPVKVLARIRETATGRVSGVGSAAHIAAGIRWAVDNGARIINMSLGGYADTTVEREAVAYAVSKGVVVVAAMGNDDTDDQSYPAAYPSVIAVGATDSSDRRASFSNRGNWIDVAAPGVGVRSTYWDDTYASLNGTSMASPHVAGVAALILSRNSSLTADQVGNIIRTTAKPLRDQASDPVPNDRYGHGLVQADAAVQAAAPVVVKTRQIVTCQRSIATPCVSVGTVCSLPITCQPSITIQTCGSMTIRCQPSLIDLCPSVRVLCPSQAVLCQVTVGGCPPPVSLADCPSFPCPPFRPDPIRPGEAWEEYDPYGYDPYGNQYE